MITEEQAEKALQWMFDNTDKIAEARANLTHLEEGRKRIKAIIMKEHLNQPVSGQEREAYADERYRVHLEGMKAASFEFERLRLRRDACRALVDAWRTQEASHRAHGV